MGRFVAHVDQEIIPNLAERLAFEMNGDLSGACAERSAIISKMLGAPQSG